MGDPDLLFLDEPTTGFDPSARRRAWELIEGLRTTGKTVVLTTHNLSTGLRLGTRVAVLSRGRLVHMHSSVSPGDGPALVDLLEHLAHT